MFGEEALFYVCLVIAIVCFWFFFYKAREKWDYIVGFLVGALCLALIILGLSS